MVGKGGVLAGLDLSLKLTPKQEARAYREIVDFERTLPFRDSGPDPATAWNS